MTAAVRIGSHLVGPGQPVYLVAEMSANHGQDLDRALAILHAAKEAGADAVKLQTYTADTLTIDCDNEYFRIKGGTLWDGDTLHALYTRAAMPWDWHPALQVEARALGLDLFSTPFDTSAVDYLESLDMPAYKVASFEAVDIPLLKRVAATGKPVILSTGMCTMSEVAEAVGTLRAHSSAGLVLLKCTSAYPAPPEEMRLGAIARMVESFACPVGLSDHTTGVEAALAAVALGACMVEKHFTLSRGQDGPDSSFSLEPQEFRALVEGVRAVEKAIAGDSLELTERQKRSIVFRRSLFVVKDVAKGEVFSPANVRSIRPGHGLHTRHLEEVLGKRAARPVRRGTPLSWDLVEGA